MEGARGRGLYWADRRERAGNPEGADAVLCGAVWRETEALLAPHTGPPPPPPPAAAA